MRLRRAMFMPIEHAARSFAA